MVLVEEILLGIHEGTKPVEKVSFSFYLLKYDSVITIIKLFT